MRSRVKAKYSKTQAPMVPTPTLAPMLRPSITVETVKPATLRHAAYVPQMPLQASVVTLTASLNAVLVYEPAPVRVLPPAPDAKAFRGSDRRAGVTAFVKPARSYSETRLVRTSMVTRPMFAVIGRGKRLPAFPRSILRRKLRVNGAVDVLQGAYSRLPSTDAYSYGCAPLIPLTGFIGSAPLIRPSNYPKTSANGDAIRMPYPRKGEPARCLW